MTRRHSLFVAGEDGDRPDVEISRVEPPSDGAHRGGGWRIDITLGEGQEPAVLPRLRALRQDPQVFRHGIEPGTGHSGHRPEWNDLFYLPRTLPGPGHRLMRRFNGSSLRPLWIFGPDDRRLYRDSSYPWGCIGMISNSDGLNGSGVLVGRNLVATAGHLVPWDAGDGGWMKFVPADYLGLGSLYGQNVYSYAVEARGYNTNNQVAGYDWAILKLDQPLGDMIGYMGYNSYSDGWEDVNCWTVVGYPSGVGPFWQGGISVNDDDEDSNDGQELESENADLTGGNRAAPCSPGGAAIHASSAS